MKVKTTISFLMIHRDQLVEVFNTRGIASKIGSNIGTSGIKVTT